MVLVGAGGTRQTIDATSLVVHAVSDGSYTKGMNVRLSGADPNVVKYTTEYP